MIDTSVDTLGFRQVHSLGKSDPYGGDADFVMLVWNYHQILPADQYRKARHGGKVVDLAVCEDPNVQKKQLGDKCVIYHFDSNSSGGGPAE